MSVELYVYPQSFDEGSSYPISFLADTDFSTLGAATSIVAAGSGAALIAIVPTSLPFIWYRYGTSAAVYPTSPGTGIVYMPFGGGILQRITGLTIGESYELKFDYAANSGANVFTFATGTAQVGGTAFTGGSAGSSDSFMFTALDSVHTITWDCTAPGMSATIENVTLKNVVPTQLSDGQVLVDLFDQKQIPLTLSVDNFQNAAEKTQSYSKSFKLPGTDRNNKIFRNVFDVTSSIETNSIDFNPYRKTPMYLQEEGHLIFKGFLKLISVDRKGENLVYNVNLFSETVKIKDDLKGKTFYDIDLTELNHAYVKSTIKSSWDNTPGLTLAEPLPAGSFAGAPGATATRVIKYPFVDWSHGATIASNPGAPPNPGPADGQPEFSSLGQIFRPWIQLRYLINRIFEGIGYTYTSSIIDSADFKNLFMDFNWGANRAPMIGANIGLSKWKYTNSPPGFPTSYYALNSAWSPIPLYGYWYWSSFSLLLPGYNSSSNVYTSTTNFTNLGWNNTMLQWENTGAADVDIIVEIVKNGGFTPADTVSTQFTATANSNGTHSMSANFLLMAGDTVEQRWITLLPGAPQTVRVRQAGSSDTVNTTMTEMVQNMVSSSILLTKRGKLKQWDFIKGLLSTFNLLTVADPTNNKNIIIEPYSVIFPRVGAGVGALTLKSRGILRDWTELVDDKEINLKPLTKLKKTTLFKYVTDNNDYTATNYKNAFGGFEYGSLTFDASDLNLLVGQQKIEATPFAATLNKPFDGLVPDLWAPAIYKLKDDGTSEEFDNKPRILYDNGRVTMSTGTFYIPSANGEASENATTYLQFSGFSDIPILPTSNDLNFGTCQLIGENNTTALTLFNRYYSAYYFDLYNPDTRIVTLKIKLTSGDINQFSFSDIVMIKNRAYRVNKINYNPGQLAKVELVLIP